ncbi:MAG: hypothetical protein U0M06_10660 [Clostridia bacterium]|nr:hypothetical protein [Clostridia bacterium]
MKNVFLKVLNLTALFFTFFILLICLTVSIFVKGDSFGLFPAMVFGLFAVSLAISFATVFYTSSKIHGMLKYLLHLIITIVSFSLLFRFANGLEGKTILIASVIISIIHAVIFSLNAIFNGSSRKNAKYESVYKK